MWIDTHCHLDAAEFGGRQAQLVAQAAAAGVSCIVVPAVAPSNFDAVASLSAADARCVHALGIHPLYVAEAREADLARLRAAAARAMPDPRFVAIGEIGLDFFVPELRDGPLRDKQEFFFAEQLKIAREFELPVLLHVRRAQDVVLKHLRRIGVAGGIAHAFNGSFQQAQRFIEFGFRLGFGGAMTYPRALQIRRLASQLPLGAIVLETDAPDIAPSWLHPAPNRPDQIPRIGVTLAALRGLLPEQVAEHTGANAAAAIPRLAQALGNPR
ncbi:MAG: TatD family hydrolase [Burkholderiaceae bacterium]